jgi:hypothetical protein
MMMAMMTGYDAVVQMCGLPVDLLVVVTNRGHGEKLAEKFSEKGVTFNLFCLGRGTADKKLLNYLGLGDTEKEILFSTMPYTLAHRILDRLNGETALGRPGSGIAFCIPVSGIADTASCKRLQGAALEKEEIKLEKKHIYDLILAITNQGYADEVMDEAKAAGATGGTIVHARGAGLKEAEKFFGITIRPEKEMLFILTHKDKSQPIMSALVEKSGLQTDAKTIALSLMVTGVAGFSERAPEPGVPGEAEPEQEDK